MTRQSWSAFIVVAVLISSVAAVLAPLQRSQRLGAPGLKLVPEPFPVFEGADSRLGAKTFSPGSNSVYLPPKVLDYRSVVLPIQRTVYDYLPKDTTFGQRMYAAPDGFSVQNTVVLMGMDRTSIHQPQYCLAGSGFQIVSQQEAVVPMEHPVRYRLPVMKLITTREIRDAEGRSEKRSGVFLYWFVADGQLTAQHADRMWRIARELIQTRVLQRWAYVIYFAECSPGAEDATFRRLQDLIDAAVPEFQLATTGPVRQ